MGNSSIVSTCNKTMDQNVLTMAMAAISIESNTDFSALKCNLLYYS